MGPQLERDLATKKTETNIGKSNSVCEFKQVLKTVKDPLKPLRYKSFYLDLKDYKGLQDLKEDILLLGGVLESFISKEVSCVVTNKPLSKPESNGLPGINQNINSPIFSPVIDSPSTSDTPAEDQKKKALTRGNKMLEKAVRVVKGTGDVLQNAQKWGVQVVTLPRFLSWLENFKSKHNIKKSKIDKKKRAENQREKSVVYLMEPFIKFEAVTRQYRPVYKQLRKWPELVFDMNSCSSPFSHTNHSTDNRRQTSTRRSMRSEHEVNRNEQSKPANKTIRDKKQLNFKRKHGYCEICSIPYTNLFKHLETSQHQKFVSDEKNYASLDKVIASGCELSDYLEAVKLNSSADEVKLLTPVQPRFPSADTADYPDGLMPRQYAQTAQKSNTPEKLGHETAGNHQTLHAEIDRNLFPNANNLCQSLDFTDKGVVDFVHDSAVNKLNDPLSKVNSGNNLHTFSTLPDINQNNEVNTPILDQKVVDNNNESWLEVIVETIRLVTPNPQMEESAHVEEPTLSHTVPQLIDALSVDFIDCLSCESMTHIKQSDMQSYNTSIQPGEYSCQLSNNDSGESVHNVEVNETLHKTLRSTVHKRMCHSQQMGDKLPLDLSMGKRECINESSSSSQPLKKPKLDVLISSITEADLPSVPRKKNEEPVLSNVMETNEDLCLNLGNNSLDVCLNNSANSLAASISKSEMLVCQDGNANYPQVPTESTQVKKDSSEKTSCGSKPRSILVLTDHSVQTLFNSDTDASDFLGFDAKDYQELPLDLSYTEIPESSSAPSSEKECSRISEDVADHESECSLSSANDANAFSESSRNVLQINGMYGGVSDSSEPWDHEVKLFLDKHVSNTAVVK